MIHRWHVGLLVAFGLLLSSGSLVAQQRGPLPQSSPQGAAAPRGGINVALVDVSYVFKNHERFKSRTEELRQEIKDFEDQMNAQRKGMNEKRNKMSEFNPGSPQYQQLEGELAREVANQNVTAELKKKDVLEREAAVYHETFGEIEEAVKAFADRHNISLVLRYDGEEINQNDRNSVLRGVNRAIVYQDKINITYEILQMVNTPRSAARPR